MQVSLLKFVLILYQQLAVVPLVSRGALYSKGEGSVALNYPQTKIKIKSIMEPM